MIVPEMVHTVKWARLIEREHCSTVALGFLVFGFLLQIVSNWPTVFRLDCPP